MVHNPYIFININIWHTAYTIALKTGTCFGKKRNFLQGSCYVNTFKGAHYYAYFLKLYIILYFCASFQLFSNILTRFRRGDFIPTRKGINEILTKIRQSFWNADQNPLSINFQISPLQQTSVMKKTVYLGLFIFKTS